MSAEQSSKHSGMEMYNRLEMTDDDAVKWAERAIDTKAPIIVFGGAAENERARTIATSTSMSEASQKAILDFTKMSPELAIHEILHIIANPKVDKNVVIATSMTNVEDLKKAMPGISAYVNFCILDGEKTEWARVIGEEPIAFGGLSIGEKLAEKRERSSDGINGPTSSPKI